MSGIKVTKTALKSGGMAALLKSAEVGAELANRASRALSAAQSSAPVESGAYKASLRVELAMTDRVVARVVSDVPHALVVQANTGNLARALDAGK